MPKPLQYGTVRPIQAHLWECKVCGLSGHKLTEPGAKEELRKHGQKEHRRKYNYPKKKVEDS